jgi:hypothetical protein
LLERQKKLSKQNDSALVLAALSDAQEPATVCDADAPVRACHRYLSSRLDHLDDQSALAQGLPIGSGEIESAHRYVVQQRLKRPGAWWAPDNAEAMLALRRPGPTASGQPTGRNTTSGKPRDSSDDHMSLDRTWWGISI